jgi:hypothetical protein
MFTKKGLVFGDTMKKALLVVFLILLLALIFPSQINNFASDILNKSNQTLNNILGTNSELRFKNTPLASFKGDYHDILLLQGHHEIGNFASGLLNVNDYGQPKEGIIFQNFDTFFKPEFLGKYYPATWDYRGCWIFIYETNNVNEYSSFLFTLDPYGAILSSDSVNSFFPNYALAKISIENNCATYSGLNCDSNSNSFFTEYMPYYDFEPLLCYNVNDFASVWVECSEKAENETLTDSNNKYKCKKNDGGKYTWIIVNPDNQNEI